MIAVSTLLQLPFTLLPVWQVGMQEALEDPPVVGREQVDQLMHDDELAELARQLYQLAVEREAACGRDGGPLLRHGADVDARGRDAHTGGPVAGCPAQVVRILPLMLGRWRFGMLLC